jgi:hypothetical protein
MIILESIMVIIFGAVIFDVVALLLTACAIAAHMSPEEVIKSLDCDKSLDLCCKKYMKRSVNEGHFIAFVWLATIMWVNHSSTTL